MAEKKIKNPVKSVTVTMVCPPAQCLNTKCKFYPVYADAYGSYRCPKCGRTWACASCD